MYKFSEKSMHPFLRTFVDKIMSTDRGQSSLAKGFAHGPLSLQPWKIELDFVISPYSHLAVFTGLAYKDDIIFDQWVLLIVSCLGRCKMAAPSVHTRDVSEIVSGDLIGHS